MRVTLQLVDAVADRQIWSRSYQATLVDAMTLQEQLAREVAEQLAVQLPTAQGRSPAAAAPPGGLRRMAQGLARLAGCRRRRRDR